MEFTVSFFVSERQAIASSVYPGKVKHDPTYSHAMSNSIVKPHNQRNKLGLGNMNHSVASVV